MTDDGQSKGARFIFSCLILKAIHQPPSSEMSVKTLLQEPPNLRQLKTNRAPSLCPSSVRYLDTSLKIREL